MSCEHDWRFTTWTGQAFCITEDCGQRFTPKTSDALKTFPRYFGPVPTEAALCRHDAVDEQLYAPRWSRRFSSYRERCLDCDATRRREFKWFRWGKWSPWAVEL